MNADLYGWILLALGASALIAVWIYRLGYARAEYDGHVIPPLLVNETYRLREKLSRYDRKHGSDGRFVRSGK